MNFGPIKNGTVPNFLLYMPSNLQLVKTMSVNLELTIRVESNLKLNLFDRNKQPFLTRDLGTNEVHFFRMEGVIAEIDVQNPMAIFSL